MLGAGTAGAQLVALAATPLLTRLFTPADFGALAVFAALSGFLTAVSVGRYEQALVLTRGGLDSAALLRLCITLAAGSAAVVLLVVGVVMPWYLDSELGGSLGMWILLLPIALLLGALGEILLNDATRAASFRCVSSVTIGRGVSTAGTQTALGVTGAISGGVGLVLGQVAGLAVQSAVLAPRSIRLLRRYRPDWTACTDAARQHAKFPKYNLPSTLGRGAILFGTPVLIGAVFGAATLGVWSVAYKFVLIPGALIGSAVARAYYRHLTTISQSGGGTRAYFDRTMIGLAVVAVPVFIVIGLGGNRLFGWLLGPEWAVAGEYIRVMLPWISLQFFTATLAPTALVHGRNNLHLLATSLQAAVLALTLVLTLWLEWEFTTFLLVLSVLLALEAAVFLVLLRSTTTEEHGNGDSTNTLP